MDTLRKGAEIIRHAERGIRALVVEAAGSAEYDELLVLAEWVKQLRALLDGTSFSPDREQVASAPGTMAPLPDGPGAYDAKASAARRDSPALGTAITSGPGESGRRTSGTQRKTDRLKRGKKRARTRREEYPKFLRDGENLVKIGWSKKDREPYEHKAPKRVLDLLLISLLEAGRNGNRFTMEDILPLNDAEEGGEIPSYQAYLCLAWLRSEKEVEQHGRQGYSLPDPKALGASVAKSWDNLNRR